MQSSLVGLGGMVAALVTVGVCERIASRRCRYEGVWDVERSLDLAAGEEDKAVGG